MMRLDKMLAHSNYGTRKEVKELIRKGFVTVNGEVIKNDDFKVDEENDIIIVFDEQIDYDKFIYLMLNKPQGYISATYDNYDPIVLDLIEGYEKRNLFPVGRLDKDTEGLLIITNDGKLAHELLSPKKHVDKKYYLKYEGTINKNYEKMLKEGVVLDDGYKTMPAKLELTEDSSAYITIKEGKYHQVKRMINVLGAEVVYLKRVEFGPIPLDTNLALGEYRHLTEEELALLRNKQ